MRVSLGLVWGAGGLLGRIWDSLRGEIGWLGAESFLEDFWRLVSERLKGLGWITRGVYLGVMVEIWDGLDVVIEFRVGSVIW